MDAVVEAVRVFARHLADVGWAPLGLALALHLAKVGCRTRAWHAIVAAAYPRAGVRWRSIFGAYVAGVGVNAVVPVRGGDVVRIVLARRAVHGSTVATLGSTMLVETIFDALVALGLLAWAITQGVLPGLDVLPRLPAPDWAWIGRHPIATIAIGAGLGLALGVGYVLLAHRAAALGQRVGQGFAVLRRPRRYLVAVVPWQAADWLLRLASIWFFLDAFGIDPSVERVLLVQLANSLATVVPITPAGIGTTQALLVYLFVGRAPATEVVSFSVGMELATAVVNGALGFAAILLTLRTLRWRRHLGLGRPREAPDG